MKARTGRWMNQVPGCKVELDKSPVGGATGRNPAPRSMHIINSTTEIKMTSGITSRAW